MIRLRLLGPRDLVTHRRQFGHLGSEAIVLRRQGVPAHLLPDGNPDARRDERGGQANLRFGYSHDRVQGDGADDIIRSLEGVADGHLLIGGSFHRLNSTPCEGLMRLREDGSPDPECSATRPGGLQRGADPA